MQRRAPGEQWQAMHRGTRHGHQDSKHEQISRTHAKSCVRPVYIIDMRQRERRIRRRAVHGVRSTTVRMAYVEPSLIKISRMG